MSELKKDILYHVMIDYDGTLCFQNKISFKNKSAIKKAQKEGYKFILNTGRSRGNLPKEALQIDWDYIICAANYIEKKGEVIYRDEIPYSSLVQVFRVAKNVGSSIEFEGEKGTLYCKKEEIKNLDEKKFNIFCDEIKEKIKENPITKVDLWKGMDNRIDAKLQDFAIIHHNEYVELFKKGATKGTIALKLMELENINQEELIGIGDSPNDLDLLNVCSYKVAMKLAPKSLKDLCDEVTNRSSTGVGDFVNKLIKIRKSKRNK